MSQINATYVRVLLVWAITLAALYAFEYYFTQLR